MSAAITIGAGNALTTNEVINTVEQFNALVNTATIAGVGSGKDELDVSVIQYGATVNSGSSGTAADTVPALRTLGTAAHTACAGNDSRLTRTSIIAAKVVFTFDGSSVTIVSQTNVAGVSPHFSGITGLFNIVFSSAIPAWPCGIAVDAGFAGVGGGTGATAGGGACLWNASPGSANSTSQIQVSTMQGQYGAGSDANYVSVVVYTT